MHPNAVTNEIYEGQAPATDADTSSRSSVDMADRSVNQGLNATSKPDDITNLGFPDVSTEDQCGSERGDIAQMQFALLSPEAKAACDALANGDYDAVNKMAPTAENALNAAGRKEFAAQMKAKGMDVEYAQTKVEGKESGSMVIGVTGKDEAVMFKSTDTADGKKVGIEAVTKKLGADGKASWVPKEDQNDVLRLLVGIEKRAAR